jgi:hypothetical protein
MQPKVSASEAAVVQRALDHGRRWRAFRVQLRWISRSRVIGYVLGNLFQLTGFLRARARTLTRRLRQAER